MQVVEKGRVGTIRAVVTPRPAEIQTGYLQIQIPETQFLNLCSQSAFPGACLLPFAFTYYLPCRQVVVPANCCSIVPA